MRAPAETFEERQAKVEAALRTFSILDSPPGTIPYSTLIPQISMELVWEARAAPPTVSRKTARNKLKSLIKTAKAMEALLSDPSLAVEIPLEERLSIVRIAHLEVDLSGQGTARKDAAARVARLLAHHFEGLTGSPPTRITPLKDGMAQPSGGPFVNLLGEIFGILGISASADSQAKSAIEAMEKNQPES